MLYGDDYVSFTLAVDISLSCDICGSFMLQDFNIRFECNSGAVLHKQAGKLVAILMHLTPPILSICQMCKVSCFHMWSFEDIPNKFIYSQLTHPFRASARPLIVLYSPTGELTKQAFSHSEPPSCRQKQTRD